VESSAEALGGTFVVMRRVAGATMVPEFEGLGRGRSVAEMLATIMRAPAIIARSMRQLSAYQARLHELPAGPLASALKSAGLAVPTFDARLERIRRLAATATGSKLQSLARWLDTNRPREPERDSICHGDFQPFNVLVEGGELRGVIDWSNAAIADSALDVAGTAASMLTVPVSLARPLKPLVYAMFGLSRYVYLRAYRRLRPLDPEAIRYYEVVRCALELAWMADARSRGRVAGAYQSAEGFARLTARIRKLSGIRVDATFAR
ncbi:MAG: phosphotransferase, partial [Candidatus Binataceae bacterium]